jgi:hypothetical protein
MGHGAGQGGGLVRDDEEIVVGITSLEISDPCQAARSQLVELADAARSECASPGSGGSGGARLDPDWVIPIYGRYFISSYWKRNPQQPPTKRNQPQIDMMG